MSLINKGPVGICSEKNGPRRPYKLIDTHKDYIDRHISENPKAGSDEIAKSLKKWAQISPNARLSVTEVKKHS